MFKSKLYIKFFIFLALGLGLFTLSYISLQTFLREAWDCDVRNELMAHQQYLQQIEKDFKDDVYFWAWINHEGFMPKEQRPMEMPSCLAQSNQKNSPWIGLELWQFIYNQDYQSRYMKLKTISEIN